MQLMAIQELKKDQKDLQAAREAESNAKLWSLEQRMSLVRNEAKLAMEVAYLASGHYHSACRHWRKLPMDKQPMNQPALFEPQEPVAEDKTGEGSSAMRAAEQSSRDSEIREVCQAIKAGKNHLRPKLRKLLLEEAPEDIRALGDTTRMAIDQYAKLISPQHPGIRESIALSALEDLRTLAPPGSSYVETVLAKRLVLAQLNQRHRELTVAAVADNSDVLGSKIGNTLEKNFQAANRELHQATQHYEKAQQLIKAETAPPRPQAGVAALKIYNPEPKISTRRSA